MSREFVFWVFAVIAVASALLCVTRRSPIASALWLVSTLFHLAGIFVLHEAHFIAAAQVLVYAGAIMVLFLFVIMLLNLAPAAAPSDVKGPGARVVAAVIGLVLLAELLVLRSVELPANLRAPDDAITGVLATEGAITAVAKPLFLAYLVPFEITSVMLLAAVVGAVVLAKRRL